MHQEVVVTVVCVFVDAVVSARALHALFLGLAVKRRAKRLRELDVRRAPPSPPTHEEPHLDRATRQHCMDPQKASRRSVSMPIP